MSPNGFPSKISIRHQSIAVFEVNHGIESTILRLTQGTPLKRHGFGPLRKLCFIG